jgi:hypothetical protein
MPKGSFAVLAVVAALVLPALAGASSIERVRISGAGVTAAFPHGIALQLAAPAPYVRATAGPTEGRWAGPDYWASRDPTDRGKTAIRWSVTFSGTGGSARTVALGATTHNWPLDKKDPLSVPHYVGKRAVGTILGYYAITHAPPPADASYEAVLAFLVAPKAYSIVRFQLSEPAKNSAGDAGSYLVNGTETASYWNRGQAFWALSGVRLLGNLPPTRIELLHAGRVLHGSVSDAFRHPVLRVPVAVERRVGASWRVATRVKTNDRGEFVVRTSGRGVYRAVAVSRGHAVASALVAFQ